MVPKPGKYWLLWNIAYARNIAYFGILTPLEFLRILNSCLLWDPDYFEILPILDSCLLWDPAYFGILPILYSCLLEVCLHWGLEQHTLPTASLAWNCWLEEISVFGFEIFKLTCVTAALLCDQTVCINEIYLESVF